MASEPSRRLGVAKGENTIVAVNAVDYLQYMTANLHDVCEAESGGTVFHFIDTHPVNYARALLLEELLRQKASSQEILQVCQNISEL